MEFPSRDHDRARAASLHPATYVKVGRPSHLLTGCPTPSTALLALPPTPYHQALTRWETPGQPYTEPRNLDANLLGTPEVSQKLGRRVGGRPALTLPEKPRRLSTGAPPPGLKPVPGPHLGRGGGAAGASLPPEPQGRAWQHKGGSIGCGHTGL